MKKTRSLINVNSGSIPVDQDTFANDVVMQVSSVSRDTSVDSFLDDVVLNMRFDVPVKSDMFYDDCGGLVNNNLSVKQSAFTRNGKPVPYFTNNNLQISGNIFNFYDDDFTIEAHCYFTTALASRFNVIVSNSTSTYGVWQLTRTSSNKISFQVGMFPSPTSWKLTLVSNATIQINQWYHVAVVRKDFGINLYINGNLDSSDILYDPIPYYNNQIQIGRNVISSDMNGYIDQVRITRAARYLSNFVPQDIPEVKIKQYTIFDYINGNVFSSQAGVNRIRGVGPFSDDVLYFDGSSYLDVPFNRDHSFFDGSSPFTLELWFKIEKNPVLDGTSKRSQCLCSFSYPTAGTTTVQNSFGVFVQGSATVTGSRIFIESFTNLPDPDVKTTYYETPIDKRWHHLAITRETKTSGMKLYLDGIQMKSVGSNLNNSTFQFNPSFTSRIGSYQATNPRNFNGFISSLRLTRSCRYFGEFDRNQIVRFNDFLNETVLLLNFDETMTQPESGTFSDFFGHSVTMTGLVSSHSDVPFGSGTSAYFDGSCYLSYAYDSRFDISTGDFTIEGWFCPQGHSANRPILAIKTDSTGTGLVVSVKNGKLSLSVGDSSNVAYEVSILGQTEAANNKWNIFAVTRTGNVFQLFLNNVLQGQGTFSGIIHINSRPLLIGFSNETAYFLGMIDDIKITKGVSKYYSPQVDKNVPTDGTAMLMHFNGPNNGVSFPEETGNAAITVFGTAKTSTTNKVFGDSSLYLDGSSYLTFQNFSALSFGIQDFCVDFWVFFNVAPSHPTYYNVIFDTNTSGFFVVLQPGMKIGFGCHDVLWVKTYSTIRCFISVWNHIVITRKSGCFYLFINGKLSDMIYDTTTSFSPTLPTGAFSYRLAAGSSVQAVSYLNGYIDEFRVINGKSQFVDSLAVPMTPTALNYISSDVALCHFNGANNSTVFPNDCGGAIRPVGSPVISTAQSKFGGSSLYLNGSSNIRFQYSNEYDIGTRDFEVSVWVYPTALGAIFSRQGATLAFQIRIVTGQKLELVLRDGGGIETITGTKVVPFNQWSHIVVSRYNLQLTTFVDGLVDICQVNTRNLSGTSGDENPTVGAVYESNSDITSLYFIGYMDEFRFSKQAKSINKSHALQTSEFSYNSEPEVSLLCHFNSGLTDLTGKTLTPYGTSTISSAQSKFGGASLYITPASGSIAVSNSPAFAFDRNFTIEFWVRPDPTTATWSRVLENEAYNVTGGWHFSFNGNDSAGARRLGFQLGLNGGGGSRLDSNSPLTDNIWHQVVVTRNNGLIAMWVDGVLQKETIKTTESFSSQKLVIGSTIDQIAHMTGYIDEIRITKGVARYKIDFDVPTAPYSISNDLLSSKLLCNFDGANNSTSFVDEVGNTFTAVGSPVISTAQSKFGGSSLYLNGSSGLIVENLTDFNLNTEDFVASAWFMIGVMTQGVILSKSTSGSSFDWCIYIETPTTIKCLTNGTNTSFSATVPQLQLNTWYHVSLVKAQGYVTIYLNGIPYGQSTMSITSDPASKLSIGVANWNNPSNFFNGYIDSVSIEKRPLVTFSPPSTPYQSFPMEQDCVMLLHGEGANNSTAIYDEKGNAVSVFGNTKISTTQKRYGNSSIYLDGSGDYLMVNGVIQQLAGLSSFTIEGWFYQTATPTALSCLFMVNTSSGGNVFGLFSQGFNDYANDTLFRFNLLGLNNWNHVALVKNGTTIKIYLNGVQLFTRTLPVDFTVGLTDTFSIGQDFDSSTSTDFFNGYIDSFMVTKGVKYSSEWSSPVSLPSSSLTYGSSDQNWSSVVFFTSFNEQPFVRDEKNHKFLTKGFVERSVLQKKFGQSSIYFGGFGSLYSAHHDDFHFPDDFTIEFWVRPDVLVGEQCLITKGDGYAPFTVFLDGTTVKFSAYSSNASGSLIGSASFGTLVTSTWYHVAVSRYQNNWVGFLNGQRTILFTSSSSPYNSSSGLSVGWDWVNTSTKHFKGYIDQLVMIKGVSLYNTSGFTPSENKFEGFSREQVSMEYPGFHLRGYGKLCDQYGSQLTVTGAVSLSSGQAMFGGASLYFDGSGGYISTPNSQVFDFSTGDFTVETWVFVPSSAVFIDNQCSIICAGRQDNSAGGGGWGFHVLYDGANFSIRFQKIVIGGSPITVVAGSVSMSFNSWHHIAVLRRQGVTMFFVNGSKVFESSLLSGVALPVPNSLSTLVGSCGTVATPNYWKATCYLSDLRVTKGFARYFSDFAPRQYFGNSSGDPFFDKVSFSLPLTGHNGSTTFWDDRFSENVVTNTNVVYNNSAISRFGLSQGTAAQFNGTSSYLTLTTAGRVTDLRDDWTFEGWLYSTSSGANRYIFHGDYSSGVNSGQSFFKNATGKLQVDLSKNSAPTSVMSFIGSTTVTDNVWHHFAFTKRGSTIRIFLDGVLDGTGTLTEFIRTPISNWSYTASIGRNRGGSSFWSGYLQGLVFTQDCKYFSSFTPPQGVIGKQASGLILDFDGESLTDQFGNTVEMEAGAIVSTEDKKSGVSSFKFSGVNDVASIKSLSRLSFGNRDFAIEFWMKTTTSSGGLEYVFRQFNSTEVSVYFDNNLLCACVGKPGVDVIVSQVTRAGFNGQFKHVMIEKQDNSAVLYVDNLVVGSLQIAVDVESKTAAVILAHFNGVNNSTTFTNSSSLLITLTPMGNSKISTDQYKFGGSSAYFDGVGDYLTAQSSVFTNLSTRDFTVEMWINLDLLTYVSDWQTIIQCGADITNGTFNICREKSLNPAQLRIEYYSSGWVVLDIVDAGIVHNQWHHLCVQRRAGMFYTFIDGVLKSRTEKTFVQLSSSTWTIGGRSSGSYTIKGYIDELRVSVGVARYSGNFSVQTTPFDESVEPVLFNTPVYSKIGGFSGFVDNFRVFSGKPFYKRTATIPVQRFPAIESDFKDIGFPSSYHESQNVVVSDYMTRNGQPVASFNGRSFLRFVRSDDFEMSLQNFSIGFWIYFNNSSDMAILNSRESGIYSYIMLRRLSSTIILYISVGSSWASITSSAVPDKTWMHVAVSRIEDAFTLYINGIFSGSMKRSTIGDVFDKFFYIGFDQGNPIAPLQGYMSNIDICSGFSRYNRNFTPDFGDTIPTLYDFSWSIINEITIPVPIAYYKLDDQNYEAIDSANRYNLTAINPPGITNNLTTIIPFDREFFHTKGIGFFGGYFQGNIKSFSAVDEFTIFFFIKTSSSNGVILEKPGTFSLTINASKLVFSVQTNIGTSTVTSQTTLSDNVVHFVTCSFSRECLTIYVDGVFDKRFDIISGGINSESTKYQMINPDKDFVQYQMVGSNIEYLGSTALCYGSEEMTSSNSPFVGSPSLFFDGNYHIEVSSVFLATFKNSSVQFRYSNNLCVETWFKVASEIYLKNPIYLFSQGLSGITGASGVQLKGGLVVYVSTSSEIVISAGNVAQDGAIGYFNRKTRVLPLTSWTHFSLSVSFGVVSLFVNGVKEDLANVSETYNNSSMVNCNLSTTDNFQIGSFGFNNGITSPYATGQRSQGLHLFDFIVYSVPKRTTNFQVPTDPLVKLNSLVNSKTLTGNQYYNSSAVGMERKIFDKVLTLSNDGITVDQVLTVPVTLDMWVWFESLAQEVPLISQKSDVVKVKNTLMTIVSGTEQSGTIPVPIREWVHIALVVTGTTAKVYVNGVLDVVHPSFTVSRGVLKLCSGVDGFLDATRIVYSERWTTNFSVPVREDYVEDPFFDKVVMMAVVDHRPTTFDPYANGVVFQNSFDGINSTQSSLSTFDDCGNAGSSVNGTPTYYNTNRNHDSITGFDGRSYLKVNTSSAVSFNQTFTLELWVNIFKLGVKMTIIDQRTSGNTGLYVFSDVDSKIYVSIGNNVVQVSSTITANWNHVAICHSMIDNSWRVFINGSQAGATVTDSTTITDIPEMFIGRSYLGTDFLIGAISDLCFTSSVLKYTTTFTPSTLKTPLPYSEEAQKTTLLLHFNGDNNSDKIIDSSSYARNCGAMVGAKLSTTQSKFGGSSLYLNGTNGCGVVIEDLIDTDLGSTDFTIDLWVRFDATPSSGVRIIASQWSQITTNVGAWWVIASNVNIFQFWWAPYSITATLLSGGTIVGGTWYHVAVTRQRDMFKMFVNGALVSSVSNVKSAKEIAEIRPQRGKEIPITIGDCYSSTGFTTSNSDFAGFIDEVRIINKAVYVTPFTPETVQYPDYAYPLRDQNIKLFIDGRTQQTSDLSVERHLVQNNGTIIGDLVGETYQAFNGTGDSLKYNTTVGNVALGDEDFCVDCWVYPINGGSNGQTNGRIIETESMGTAGGFTINVVSGANPSPVMFQDTISGYSISLNTGDAMTNSSWNHVAITRKGSRLTLWLNGVPKATTVSRNTLDSVSGGMTNGNLSYSKSGGAWTTTYARESFDVTSSEGVYFEVASTAIPFMASIAPFTSIGMSTPTNYPGNVVGESGVSYYSLNGNLYYNAVNSAYGPTFIASDIIGVAVKNGKVWFSKNGVWIGDPVTETNPARSGLTGRYTAAMSSSATITLTLRGGYDQFSYQAPAGFVSLDEKCPHYFNKNKASIGANNNNTESFYGRLDNMRITKHQRFAVDFVEPVLAGDLNASSVVLLINSNGSIVDESFGNKTVNQTDVVVDQNVKRFGASSSFFNGDTSFISVPDHQDFAFGASPFCVEMWVKNNAIPALNPIVLLTQKDATNEFTISMTRTGFLVTIVSGTTLSITATARHEKGQWHHIALIRDGANNFSFYYDGVKIISTINAITLADISAPVLIGKSSTNTSYFSGWVDGLRVTKGASRYPSEFNYPAVPYILPKNQEVIKQVSSDFYPQVTNMETGIVDGKLCMKAINHDPVNQTADVTNRYILTKGHQSFHLFKNDFTIEGWFYPLVSGQRFAFSYGINFSTGFSGFVSKDKVFFRSVGATDYAVCNVSLSGWNHIAFQRCGDMIQVYINGVKSGESPFSSTINLDRLSDFILGTTTSGVAYVNRYYGYIEGFKVTRGVARYQSNFTPATLSQKYKSGLIEFDSRCYFNRRGLVDTTTTKRGYWFNGNSDYISLSGESSIRSEKFTLEFWFDSRCTGTTDEPVYLFSASQSATDKFSVCLVSNKICFVKGTAVTPVSTFSWMSPTHVAICSSFGAIKIFVNGVNVYQTQAFFIGGNQTIGILTDYSTGTNRFKGFIQNFRILNDVALYQNNFVPSYDMSNYSVPSNITVLDQGSQMTLGNFNGSLDDVSIFDTAVSDSIVSYLYDMALQKVYGTPEKIENSVVPIKDKLSYHMYAGDGRIWGTVTDKEGNPMVRRVLLLDQAFFVVEETISNISGFYEFINLSKDIIFMVIAQESEDYRYNSIIRAFVKAE